MSYQFSSELKSGYIHCRVSGGNTRENVARYLEDVSAVCLELQCSLVLIEENLKGPGFTVTDIYRLASQGSMKAWPHVNESPT